MPSIIIVGTGAAGLLLLHMFQAEGIPPEEILCIDPFFDGGDLQRQWRFVGSNTPWARVVETIQTFNPAWKDSSGLDPVRRHPSMRQFAQYVNQSRAIL
jgi:cation diffusion facilitator CzcD-associated flavoprotein CzcO